MKPLFIVLAFLITDIKCKQNPDLVTPVKSFYSWYLKEQYGNNSSYYQVPDYKKVSDGVYVFDLTQFQNRLSEIQYFSQSYKTKLINQLKSCNQEMMKYKWDAEPESMFNLKPCNYLWGNQWVGGQGENISDFRIKQVNSKNMTVVVQILVKDSPFVNSIVELEETEDGLKISDIKLDWNK